MRKQAFDEMVLEVDGSLESMPAVDTAIFEFSVGPKSTTTEALAGMAVDVLTLLTVIIIGSAVLLAHGRRDG